MKFTPESLLQIYMDGSFTEEAQAAFDKLIRKDPVFAEKVSQAVAQRVGETPEPLLSQVEARLDGKMAAIWENHRPSPYGMVFKKLAGLTALLLGALGLYLLIHQYGNLFHWAGNPSVGNDQVPAQSGPSLTSNTPVKPSKASVKTAKAPGHSIAGQTASSISSVKVSEAGSTQSLTAKAQTASSHRSDNVAPLQPSASSQASGGTAMTGIPAGLPPVLNSNIPVGQNPAPGTAPVNAPQPQVSNQLPAGLPPLEQAPPLSQGTGTQTEEGDALRVSIETQKTQNVVVTVLDTNGKQVRQLYQGQWNAGVHIVDWDGKDDMGNPVLPGNYTVVVNADGKTMSGVVTVQPNTK